MTANAMRAGRWAAIIVTLGSIALGLRLAVPGAALMAHGAALGAGNGTEPGHVAAALRVLGGAELVGGALLLPPRLWRYGCGVSLLVVLTAAAVHAHAGGVPARLFFFAAAVIAVAVARTQVGP